MAGPGRHKDEAGLAVSRAVARNRLGVGGSSVLTLCHYLTPAIARPRMSGATVFGGRRRLRLPSRPPTMVTGGTMDFRHAAATVGPAALVWYLGFF